MMNQDRIGKSIRTLRIKAGYTQKELAEKLFITTAAVSKWERGLSIPNAATLQQLAVILDMDVDGLLDGTAAFLDAFWVGILLLDNNTIPIDTILFDKPVIDYLLSYFLLAGVRNIHIVCSEREQEFIQKRFNKGELLNIDLSFSEFENKTLTLNNTKQDRNVFLIPEPFFIYGVNLTRFLQRAMQQKSVIVNMTSVVGEECILQKNSYYQYSNQSIPFYFLQPNSVSGLMNDKDLRICLSLPEVVEQIHYEPMDKGFIVSAFKTEEDVNKISELVRLIQELGNYIIYCPLEIAWRRGMISEKKMRQAARAFPEYYEYVVKILTIH